MEKVYYYYPAPTKKGERIVLAGMADDGKLHIGMSVCSLKDTFEKKKGRAIALGRAEKSILTPAIIKDLKNYYHNMELVASSRDLTDAEKLELEEVAHKIAHPKEHSVLIVDILDTNEVVGKLFVKAIEEDGRWEKRPETAASLAKRERKKEKRAAKLAAQEVKQEVPTEAVMVDTGVAPA